MKTFRSQFTPNLWMLLVVIFAFGCTSPESELSDTIQVEAEEDAQITITKEQFEKMKMEWGNPVMQEFSEELTVQGMVKVPVESAFDVSAIYGGFVSDFKLLEGQAVRKGQVLFYLENPEFLILQQTFLEEKSQLNYLQADYERQKLLFGEQISAEKNYLKAEADYQSTLAKVESLRHQLRLINLDGEKLTPATIRSKVPVLAPITGYVAEIFAVTGAFLPASGKAISLFNKDHLHIELNVFEKHAVLIQTKQKITFNLPDHPSKSYPGEVLMVGQSINDARMINVHAELLGKSSSGLLVPGMYVQAKIALDPQEGWSVPTTAVVVSDEQSYVLIQKSSDETGFKLEKIKVQTGRISGDFIELMPDENLSETTKLLVKGGFNLLP